MRILNRAILCVSIGALAGVGCGDDDGSIDGPVVDQVVPARGPVAGGTDVTILGSGFGDGDNVVTIGGLFATNVVTVSDEAITLTSPAAEVPGSAELIVFNENGFYELPGGFSYNPLPTVTRTVPDRGQGIGGTEVSIIGTGFAELEPGTNVVSFGEDACTDVEVADDTTLNCKTPPGNPWTLVDVVVANDNGSGRADDAFGYQKGGLFVAEGRGGVDGLLYYVDPATAETVPIGITGVGLTGLASHDDGTLYGVTSNATAVFAGFPRQLVEVDPFSGAVTEIGDLVDNSGKAPVNVIVSDISMDGDTLYGFVRRTDDLAEIDRATGAVTLLGESGLVATGGAIAVSGLGLVYLAPEGSAGNLYLANPASGAVRPGALLNDALGDDLSSMTSVMNSLYAVREGLLSGGGSQGTVLIQIDPASGETTVIGELPFGVDALARTPPLPFL